MAARFMRLKYFRTPRRMETLRVFSRPVELPRRPRRDLSSRRSAERSGLEWSRFSANVEQPAEWLSQRPDANAGGLESEIPSLSRGNYVEGDTIETRFDGKRPSAPSRNATAINALGYRSTDGMGLLEFLEWCEDMKAEPCWRFMRLFLKGACVNADPNSHPMCRTPSMKLNMCPAIPRRLGAPPRQRRHPAPFKLDYVEWQRRLFDKSKVMTGVCAILRAIKAKYRSLKYFHIGTSSRQIFTSTAASRTWLTSIIMVDGRIHQHVAGICPKIRRSVPNFRRRMGGV